ncbi:MAG: OmpA family protein [Nonlabens sp.]|uniref:OmpA family protein n=1 Tax=Nonlabens sp. TaxID=1888209 RepID=UPI003EF7E7B5
MRLIITSILTMLFVATSVNAQNLSLKKTNRLFKDQAYKEAIENYENLKQTEQVLKNLGDSYYFTGDMAKAAFTYSKIEDNYGAIEDYDRIYRYAQSLLALEDYDKADRYLLYYHGKDWNTKEYIKELKKITPHNFNVATVNNQGTNSDFGMTFLNANQVVFASSRNLDRPVYAWNGLPYLDLYKATIDEYGTLGNIEPFSEVNTNLHESNAVFTNNGTVMYFNRNNENRVKIDDSRVSNMKIYKAELIESKWTNVEALSFNNDMYSVQHPAISKDGKTLYFSSDMPGGFGGFDLYKVAINEDGTYGTPQNLGKEINTPHLDQFPYMSDINTLYYATNGKQGVGGLDIHRSDLVNGEFTTPINLGTTINSSRDDFAYIVNEKTDKVFFSSNRSGIDKLYQSVREDNILTKYAVSGVVQDSISGKLLPGSLVSLLDEREILIDDMIVGKDASYFFKLDPNKKYTIRGTRKLYIPQNVQFSTDKNGSISHDIMLTMLSYQDAEETIKPDRKGDVQVELDQIFFDFDKAVIKPEAAKTLDKLVTIMKKYPAMYIEVSSHTDARGTSEYNLELSNKRAASTMEYLVSRGVERRRLRSIGYGEMQPLNNCVSEGMCSEDEYRINRRCEFKIVK